MEEELDVEVGFALNLLKAMFASAWKIWGEVRRRVIDEDLS